MVACGKIIRQMSFDVLHIFLNHSNSMYSPIAAASIKDLEIKDNKAMVHTEKSYPNLRIYHSKCLLQPLAKTVSFSNSFFFC